MIEGSGGPTSSQITFRRPRVADGAAMWRIARDSGGLDVNSPYSYLLWCRDFPATSAVGCLDGEVVAFATGYRRPDEPDTLFVWQVAVAGGHRRRRVGLGLLDALVAQATRSGPVTFVEATVTPGNPASRRLFESFAAARGCDLRTRPLFGAPDFASAASHEDEVLHRIGPLAR
ncbi:diaminobutyrate acetyltransferase [Saccharothrix sp. S26]|uniref:diaminobutyrate acetyltransferase n=1 Tax=Saccharothrix sp. S26 TaxID=2907215 RepID=UPI001F461829|nr:diaminobutyrate acetyltransferase [Saccharothrix sp. S26]MCE6995242.1 diaminobutyrate acetyltransferase [Saccharothrix sp. S26]